MPLELLIDPPRGPEPSPGMQLASNVVDDLRRSGCLLYGEGRISSASLRVWQAFAEGYVAIIEELEK